MVYGFTHFLYSQKHEAWDDDLQDDAFKAKHSTRRQRLLWLWHSLPTTSKQISDLSFVLRRHSPFLVQEPPGYKWFITTYITYCHYINREPAFSEHRQQHTSNELYRNIISGRRSHLYNRKSEQREVVANQQSHRIIFLPNK